MRPNREDIQRQLLGIFRQEQTEHLEAIRSILSTASFNEGAGEVRPLSKGEQDEIFRRVHSLKGAARAVDFDSVEQIAHRTESFLSQLRAEQIFVPETILYTHLQEVLDVFEALALLRDSNGPELAQATQNAIQRAMTVLETLESATVKPSVPNPIPSVPKESPEPAPPSRPELGDEIVRVPSKFLDNLLTTVRQFQLEMERHQHFLATEKGHELQRRYREHTWQLQRLAAQMQEEVQFARLISVGSAVEGMERMLDSLARQNGKEVALQIEGRDLLVDRQVVQALRDLITHLLRNTISHGIETTSERQAAGKDTTGKVEVRFRVRGTRLEVDVQDDGRGLNAETLRRTSVKAGLLAPDAAETTSLEQVAQLIFQPGFSTFTGTASNLAGRGMGLSIVAQAVARFGGEVRVLPVASGGTRFRLWLPLSVATHRLLLVEVNGQVFGLPTFIVEGLYRIAPEQLERVEGNVVVRLPDHPVLSVSDLGQLIGLPSAQKAGERLSIVVVTLNEERYALVVHRFRQEATLAVSPLSSYLAQVPLFGGSVVLGDGTIGLTLLPAELARRINGGQRTFAATALSMPEVVKRQHTILVVDDSITTRTLEKSILESHGYLVRLAIDGEEALMTLRESLNQPDNTIDLVVTDLEMPRKNGFELLRDIKANERLRHLPVILVTSREAFEDREQGLSLGADAYIVKRKFDQTDLLETIEQLLN